MQEQKRTEDPQEGSDRKKPGTIWCFPAGFKRWDSVTRAVHAAGSLGLTGWVKNCWDGTVEMEAQGRPEEIRRMIHMIADSRYIVIENIQAREIAVETESGFHIR